MQRKIRIATIVGLGANILLFIIKAIAGFMTNSIALISDAANSFMDIFGSIVLYVAVKLGQKRADKTHPFGHHRAEPIGAMVIAIFTGILGFELLKESAFRIFSPEQETMSAIAIIVLVIAIIAKLILFFYFESISKKMKSPAMHAYAVDSRNDVLASFVALAGIILSHFGLKNFDGIAGILISLWIFYTGYKLAAENIDYLLGKSPCESYINKLRNLALKVKGVTGVNDIRAHYVGHYIHVELHAEVNKKISTQESHKIGKKVQAALENLPDINKAFIHIDPVTKKNK
jgi:cation diffusion facilitator family transporter